MFSVRCWPESTRLLPERPRRAAELAEAFDLQLAADEQREMSREHGHHPLALRAELRIGLHAEQVVVIRDLAAGLAAGVEARRALRALPVQREQAKTLPLALDRRLAPGDDPVLEHFLRIREQRSPRLPLP